MKTTLPLLLALLPLLQPAAAATLYRWTDASGTPRYGYQPPPGVEVAPADEERREVYEKGPELKCRDLAEQHLALIDKEIARVRAIETGLGPEFELSPAAQQELVMDLLAHRAALLTGRPASEFRSPSADEVRRERQRLQGENAKLTDELKSQQATLDAQQKRLERARREANRPWVPGYGYPGLPVIPPVIPVVPPPGRR